MSDELESRIPSTRRVAALLGGLLLAFAVAVILPRVLDGRTPQWLTGTLQFAAMFAVMFFLYDYWGRRQPLRDVLAMTFVSAGFYILISLLAHAIGLRL